MFNPKTLQSSLKPLFYFTKLFGLSPFSINDNNYENSLLNVFWSIILLILIGSYSFFSVNYNGHHTAIITRITNALHVHLCIVSFCIGLLFGCIRRKDIVEVINNISDLDSKLNVLNLNINVKETYRKGTLYSTVTLFFAVLYIISLVALDVVAFLKKPDVVAVGELIAYNAPIVTIFVQFQFCTLVLLLKQRFTWINVKIMEVGKNINECVYPQKKQISTTKINRPILDTKLMKTTQTKSFSTLEQISVKHYELCNISKKLNKAYSGQILLIVVQSFMSIIAMSFYLAKYIFSKGYRATRLDYRIYFGPTLLLYSMAVLTLTVICSSTAKQAQKTGSLLHRAVSLYLCINDGYLDLGVTCFSLQLLHQNVNFTACRLFVLDETLLSSVSTNQDLLDSRIKKIVGAATTYLVIVLQFEIGVIGDRSNTTISNISASAI